MKIIGIGTDIVQIDRVAQSIERYGDKFTQRILHPVELAIFQEHPQQNAYLAKRFAAKEALSKALGTGIAQGVSFIDIETRNDSNGKPEIVLHAATQAKAASLGVSECMLSLSDEKDYAVAFVTLVGE